MILVDTNVVIDVIERDDRWFAWSFDRLADALADDGAAVNPVIFAECAPRFATLEEQAAAFGAAGLSVVDLDMQSAFLAGQAFGRYRRSQGDRTAILADFLVGGHAQASGMALLTRDPRFYVRYFPSVPLISPLKDDHD